MKPLRASRLLAALFVAGCTANATDAVMPSSPLQNVPDSAWSALGSQRIFFGHQSVGSNILDGVQEVLAEHPRVPLRVEKTDAPGQTEGPGLFHAFIGDNRRPDLKNGDFARLVDGGFGRNGDVAMMKYCYLDVGPDTDVEKLFAEYRHMMDSLGAKYPGVTFVHVTQPLFAAETPLVSRLRLALGRSSDRVLNRKRGEFNRLLRAEYGATGRVFDLAALESTRPDGSRVSYTVGSDTVYALAPDYTEDGGHLDARGRRLMAEHFLAFLATLPTQRATR